MRTVIVGISLWLASLPVVAEDTGYPRAELLIEPSQLAESLANRPRVILDVRPRQAYEQSHVPGALWIDADQWKQAFANNAQPAEWSERIGGLGIATDDTVVVYDDNSSKDAARIWWILRFWGVEDTQLLNGGWNGWQAARGPTQQEVPPTPQRVDFQAQPTGQRLATKDSILESLANESLQIVDARSESEFCGLDPRGNRRAGAIPGAKHLEWSDLIDAETQRFKSAAELRKLFDQAKIQLDEPVASHCQSGGRASVMAFAMELMGAPRVQNYYAGWSEWGNTDDTPVTKPEPQNR